MFTTIQALHQKHITIRQVAYITESEADKYDILLPRSLHENVALFTGILPNFYSRIHIPGAFSVNRILKNCLWHIAQLYLLNLIT